MRRRRRSSKMRGGERIFPWKRTIDPGKDKVLAGCFEWFLDKRARREFVEGKEGQRRCRRESQLTHCRGRAEARAGERQGGKSSER